MRLTPLEPWMRTKIGGGPGRLLRTDLEAYQIERLRQTIRLGREKSRFYARRLANAPHEISRLEDLAAFPFTTPEDLRSQGREFLCVSQSDIQRVVTLDTSGTTGVPKRLYFTQADQELTIDFFQHGMSTLVGAGEKVLILLPGERPGSVGDLLATGLRRLGAIPVPHGPVKDPRETLAIIQDQKIASLVGAPTHVLGLARFWEKDRGLSGTLPGAILLSTDHVPRAIVKTLESLWGCQVYNHYGMTETGLGGGVECQARRGYHLREADLYYEIIDPQTGQPVEEGQSGEVVFTTLTRRGMPFIRYRTGDLSRFIPGGCACGTVLKTMERITHRLGGGTALGPAPEDELTMPDLDEALFPIPGLQDFSAALVDEAGRDCLEINLVMVPGASDRAAVQARRALADLPLLRRSSRETGLVIRVKARTFQASGAGSLAKRVIVDKRGKKHARNLV